MPTGRLRGHDQVLLRGSRRPGDADPIEPHIEHGPACLFHRRTEPLSVGAELVQIDAGGGELERVPDQPALHALGVLLDMELQRQYFAVIVAECLMRRDRSFGKPGGATRQVEGIAVPMEHPELVLGQRGEWRFAPIRGEAEQAPADLLLAIRIDTGAEYRGERLRAEANPD